MIRHNNDGVHHHKVVYIKVREVQHQDLAMLESALPFH